MTREPKTERLILSRFFHKNISTLKSKDIIKDFENSADFSKASTENKNVKTRKKAKRKIFGPQFKGFTNKDRENSIIYENQLNKLVAKIENRIDVPKDFFGFSKKELEESNNIKQPNNFFLSFRTLMEISHSIEGPNDFLGFSKEEIDSSNQLCDNSNKQIKYFQNNTYLMFRGFSSQKQNESISKLSQILKKCLTIRQEIYKNIDRRILTYHLKEEKSRRKIVCSKYWLKPEQSENGSQTKKGLVKIEDKGCLKIGKSICKRNGLKMETIKTEMIGLKEENNCVSEIFKFKQELKASRKSSPSPTKDMKLQDAPFIQIKNELVVPSFVPPRSPHNLIEEDLYHDPWALLIATIFLNKTAGRSARPYIFWFLEENPEPLIVLGKTTEQLKRYFGALGLQTTRATQVWRMSHDFIYKKWQKVSELYGIGRYGEDAFRMFCLGDFYNEPKDRYLRIYKAWYEMQERGARLKEMNS